MCCLCEGQGFCLSHPSRNTLTTTQKGERSSSTPSKRERGPIKRPTNIHLKSRGRQRQGGRHSTPGQPELPPCSSSLLLFLITKYARYPSHRVDLKEVTVSDNTSTALWECHRDTAVALYYKARTKRHRHAHALLSSST